MATAMVVRVGLLARSSSTLQRAPMTPRRLAASLLAATLSHGLPALAQDAPPPADTPHAPAGVPDGARATESGAFLPYGLPARFDAPRAFAAVQGGYDTGRSGATFDLAVQATVVGPVSLRGGAGYVGPDGALRPSVGLSVNALQQAAHGVDLSIYGGYQSQGFNTVPAVNALVAVGRRFGRLSLLGNVGYGYGLDEGEHYGEARLAGLVRVLPNLHLGVDARGRMDLERDDDEPMNEPDFEVLAGPVASLSFGRFTVSAHGGVSIIKFRNDDAVRAGAMGTLLFGSAF